MGRIIMLLALGCLFFQAPDLSAAEEMSFGLGLGLNSELSPYKGCGAQWSAKPIVDFESRYFFINGFDAGVYLLKDEALSLAVVASYNDFSFSPSDSSGSKMRRLKKRRSTVLGGVELSLLTPAGLFQAGAGRDLLGRSEGFEADLSWSGMLELGRLKLIPCLGLGWQSGKYLDYYYGISAKEASRSGFKAYEAGSGWSPYAELACDLQLTEHWDFLLLLETERLSRSVRTSPMVNKKYTCGATAGLVYNF